MIIKRSIAFPGKKFYADYADYAEDIVTAEMRLSDASPSAPLLL